MVARRCRRRCGSSTRRGRPGTGLRVRVPRRGSAAWSRRRRRSGARRPIGSRPTGGTPSGWRGCCGWARSSRCGCPSRDEEAARDLVRAREDARGDLMRARHRLSKLLLRHGLVYDATAWTRAHDAWLRRQRFDSGPLAIVFDECYGAVLDAKARRDALDKAIAELAGEPPYVDVVERLVCLRGVSTLTAFALTVELGDWKRFRPRVARPVPRPHPERGLKRRAAPPRRDHQDRQHARAPAAGRGRLAPTPAAAARASRSTRRRQGKPAAVRAQADRSARRLHAALARARGARQASHDRRGRRRARARRPLLGARDDGVAAAAQRLGEESAPAQRREERPAIQL